MDVLIFDWDRAYSPDLGDNPILSKKTCDNKESSNLCICSQCNIIIDNYSTDFFKIISYITLRDDFNIILEKFGINDKKKQTIIHNFLEKALKEYFSEEYPNGQKCTYMYNPELNVIMKDTIQYFGSMNDIISKVNNPNFTKVSFNFKGNNLQSKQMRGKNILEIIKTNDIRKNKINM